MVIIIVAYSCTGKTNMAQKLLEKYKIPYMSMDHLKMGIYRGDGNCNFTPEDDDEFIADKLWPILKGIIKTNIENSQNIIIEGCYIMPRQLRELEDEYLEHVIPVYMGFSKEYIEENFITGIIKNRNVIEFRGCNEERPIEQFIENNIKVKERCRKEKIRYFEISECYNDETTKIYKYIDQKVNKLKERC